MITEVGILGIALKETLASGAADKAVELVSSVKENSDKNKTITAYESALTQLIQENHELKTIAMGYREQIEQIYLSEQDIEYLQQTAIRLLNLFIPEVTERKKEEFKTNLIKQQGKSDKTNFAVKQWETEQKNQRESIEQFIDLIQVDTLRTMQLLGFNYKEAIGEPLTKLVASSITNSTNISENF